jgi:hypothetical protein
MNSHQGVTDQEAKLDNFQSSRISCIQPGRGNGEDDEDRYAPSCVGFTRGGHVHHLQLGFLVLKSNGPCNALRLLTCGACSHSHGYCFDYLLQAKKFPYFPGQEPSLPGSADFLLKVKPVTVKGTMLAVNL